MELTYYAHVGPDSSKNLVTPLPPGRDVPSKVGRFRCGLSTSTTLSKGVEFFLGRFLFLHRGGDFGGVIFEFAQDQEVHKIQASRGIVPVPIAPVGIEKVQDLLDAFAKRLVTLPDTQFQWDHRRLRLRVMGQRGIANGRWDLRRVQVGPDEILTVLNRIRQLLIRSQEIANEPLAFLEVRACTNIPRKNFALFQSKESGVMFAKLALQLPEVTRHRARDCQVLDERRRWGPGSRQSGHFFVSGNGFPVGSRPPDHDHSADRDGQENGDGQEASRSAADARTDAPGFAESGRGRGHGDNKAVHFLRGKGEGAGIGSRTRVQLFSIRFALRKRIIRHGIRF